MPDRTLEQMPRDPRVGDTVGFRDRPTRTVVKLWTDACDQKCVTYTVERYTTVKNWKRWARNATVDRAEETKNA